MIQSFWWLITRIHIWSLVEGEKEKKKEKTGQTGSDRQQGGVHIGDRGATGVETNVL